MSLSENVKTMQFKIDSKFAFNFDELQNIELTNRKSDQGFSEEEKMMIKMRRGTTSIGNTHDVSGGVSNQFFFTDFYRNRWHFKGYDNKIWRLESNVWVDLVLGFTGNEFNFNSIQLPLMSDGTIPTEYTAPTVSPGAEQINKAVGDTTVNPIGQYLIITDDPNGNQSYRGAFAGILADDGTSYTLNGAGIASAVQNGAKYQIYDTLGEHLQIINGIENEKFIFIKSDNTVVENTFYTGMVTANLRNVKAIGATDFVEKQVSYYASYRIFNKGTLYPSFGTLNNPFYYVSDGALTIPGNNGGTINDIFIFKGRMIVGGNNFIAYFTGGGDVTEVEMITKSYGIVAKSLVDLGIDAYFLTTNKQIYSLSETITGTIRAENVGKIVANYLKDFNYGVCAGYDGRYLYFYGQLDSNTGGKIVVLDVEYKFWSTYTGLRPSTIILEGGSVYLSDNNTSVIRIFSDGTITDTGTAIEQKVSLKDIDLGDAFSVKSLSDIYLWLDNYDQVLSVDTYMSLSSSNTEKARKKITIQGVDTSLGVGSIGEGIVGEGLIGGIANTPEATYPFMKHIDYNADKANIWKVIITGFEGSPFYLNQLDIEIGFDGEKEKAYFNPADTI